MKKLFLADADPAFASLMLNLRLAGRERGFISIDFCANIESIFERSVTKRGEGRQIKPLDVSRMYLFPGIF